MFKYLKEYRFYIILFIFILVPILALDTQSRAPRDYKLHDRVINAMTAIPQEIVAWILEEIVNVSQHYLFLLDTKDQNQKIFEENRRLMNSIVNLKEADHENQRLRKLLDFKEAFELKTIAARVIAKDVSPDFRAIRINRGESSGIRKNMAVVNSEGVVGRILRTTANTADIMTILDNLSAIDSIVQRSRVRGIVEGMTDATCQLKFALRTDDILPDDQLISSGLGGIYPKGVSVGTVSKVIRKKYGITQAVEVIPSVDFSRLEEVLILTETGSAPVHAASDLGPLSPGTLKAKPR